MTRDMDLFRAILLEVEKQPAGTTWNACPLLDHSQEEVVAHIRLIADAGLIDARFLSAVDNGAAFVIRITNDGYEFLEESRELTFWEKAKQRIKSVGAPLTIEALKLTLNTMVREHLSH